MAVRSVATLVRQENSTEIGYEQKITVYKDEPKHRLFSLRQLRHLESH